MAPTANSTHASKVQRADLHQLEAAHRFALAATGVVGGDEPSCALWLLADHIWRRMVAAPIRSPGEAAVKVRMIAEAFEQGHSYRGGPDECLDQLRRFVVMSGLGGEK